MKKYTTIWLTALLVSVPLTTLASETPDGAELFKKKCALCHDIDKKKIGPAVKTMSQEKSVLRTVIIKGEKSMPSFNGKLSDAEIEVVVNYLLKNQQ